MRLRRPPGTGPNLGDSEPDNVVAGIIALRDWYEHRARWHRRWFRISGIVTILLSAALPLAAGLDFDGKDTVIGSIGVVIAVLAGLRNFYKWDQLWAVLRRSAFELTVLIERWRLDVAALDGADAVRRMEITGQLLEDANVIRERESLGYFSSLEFPSERPPGGAVTALEPGASPSR